MAKRKARPRYTSGKKKGQFMSDRAIAAARKRGGSSKRRRRSNTPARSSSSSSSSRPAPRRRRSNPPRMRDVLERVTQGIMDGLLVTGAQGVTRLTPTLLRLPQRGALGFSVQTATAVVVGMIAEAAWGRETGRLVTAAGVAVPITTAALVYGAPRVPILTAAFVPTLSAYPRRGMRGYSRPALPSVAPDRSTPMGAYDYAAGIF